MALAPQAPKFFFNFLIFFFFSSFQFDSPYSEGWVRPCVQSWMLDDNLFMSTMLAGFGFG
jgi:hypothetical protein